MESHSGFSESCLWELSPSVSMCGCDLDLQCMVQGEYFDTDGVMLICNWPCEMTRTIVCKTMDVRTCALNYTS